MTASRVLMIEVRNIAAVEDFLQLAQQWDSLLESTARAEPHLTHEWFEAWWKAFLRGRTAHILVAFRNDRLVGIAPFMRRQAKLRGLPIREVCFMANGQSPGADFIIADSDVEEVLDSFLACLLEERHRWDVLRLQQLSVHSPVWTPLRNVLKARQLRYGSDESLKSPIICTTGNWETFLKDKPRNFRKSLRNKLNRIERLGSVSVERLTTERAVEGTLEDIFLVSSRSWKHGEGTAITNSPRRMTFYKEISRTMGQRGWVEVWLMRDGRRPIAFEYHLKYQGASYPIRADFDEDYGDFSPGSVLEYHILKELFHDPEAKLYNSCGHTYRYLLNWTSQLNEHLTTRVFNRRPFSRFLYSTEYRAVPLLRSIRDKILGGNSNLAAQRLA